MPRLVITLLIFTLAILLLASCQDSPTSGGQAERAEAATEVSVNRASQMLVDGESPDISIVAKCGTLATPDPTKAAPVIARDSKLPQSGLWSLRIGLNGPAVVTCAMKEKVVRQFDTLTIQARCSSETLGVAPGQVRGRAFVGTTDGTTYFGDWCLVFSQWQGITVDLIAAREAGVELDALAIVGIELAPASDAPVDVLTDSWELSSSYRAYVGQRLGVSKSFYVQRDGNRLAVGVVGRFELAFIQRATDPATPQRAWMEVRQGEKSGLVLGQEGTGLMLLDQDQRDRLGKRVIRNDGEADGLAKETVDPAEMMAWPGTATSYEWEVAWTSPIGALVEVRQSSGPYDRLGRAAVQGVWRFMIYQTGQVFVSVSWEAGAGVSNPAAVALVLNKDAFAASPAATQPFMRDLYPEGWTQKVLPHDMQAGAPVAMFAKMPEAKESWWEAATEKQRIFGVGIPARMRGGAVDCMLLINSPTPVDQVSAISSYMAPAAVTMKVGTLDTTFPGDFDNDSLVEPYGFQTIRMAEGRAWFTVEPGNRPIFYPTLLLTIPAAERERTDLSKFNLIVNVDGQQVLNPPRWPDGSFLVQLPFIVSKAVRVEATLTPK